MRALLFTPNGGPGFAGAFEPEAERFCRRWPETDWHAIEVEHSTVVRRGQVIVELAACTQPLDLVAFMCHGWHSGIQLGFSKEHAKSLAQAIRRAGKTDVKVVLYACSTADDPEEGAGTAGEDSFADLLRDELCLAPSPTGAPDPWTGWVDAHDRRGHTTSNPYVRRMDASLGGGRGGEWLVQPDTKYPALVSYRVWAEWDRRLHDRDGGDPLRFEFPLFTREEIAAVLG